MSVLVFAGALVILFAAVGAAVWKVGKGSRRAKAVIGACIGLATVGAGIWSLMPFRMIDVKAEDVESIVIFSGHTGKDVTLTDDKDISGIVECLGDVRLQRSEIGMRSGYSLKVTVNMKNGGSTEYIINGDTAVSGGFVIYKVTEGKTDYDRLLTYVEN
ncbi:hypothetical protein [Ruminococcus sp.]|uniref:hypothetical protein n=1 Tax=Ruminococcus sp. TaxID=41978 RepID=UPI0025EF58EC|nr:hypothetical protein [Ruminococcus sp.]MBQ8967976.1 hypothetical protein [Ruminococcus sp.]